MPGEVSSTRIDEATESLNTRKFYFLLIFVSVIGAVGALMMIAFFFLEGFFSGIIWNDIPVHSLAPVFNPWILIICVAEDFLSGSSGSISMARSLSWPKISLNSMRREDST